MSGGGYISNTKRNSKISLMNIGNNKSKDNSSDPLIIMEKEQNIPAAGHYKLKRSRDWSHRTSIEGLGAVFPRSKRECTFIDPCIDSTHSSQNAAEKRHVTESHDPIDINENVQTQTAPKNTQPFKQYATNDADKTIEININTIWYLLFNLCICIGIILLFPDKHENNINSFFLFSF